MTSFRLNISAVSLRLRVLESQEMTGVVRLQHC